MLPVFETGLNGVALTLKQFQSRFPNDAACLEAMMLREFGGTTLSCPRCAVTARFHPMTKRRAYACQCCGHHIYPCAGTVLRRTRTPLSSWFFAMHVMASDGKAVAAAELERQIGCDYKTARRMVHAFKNLQTGSTPTPRPAADETIGGFQPA
jgi:transposase